MLMRLDKIIASLGICSRSQVKSMLRRITVDGKAASAADMKVDPENSVISVDGVEVNYKSKLYYMLNKPAGYVSATEDATEKTVLDLFPQNMKKAGLFPVGRLDKDSEGLLIITNDGEFGHKITSPKGHVEKLYYVKTEGRLDAEDIARLENGIVLRDSTHCLPAKVKLPEQGNEAYITVGEGKYHQVKRMCAACGKPVKYLKRVKIGGLELDSRLQPGEFRELSNEEIEMALQKRDLHNN